MNIKTNPNHLDNYKKYLSIVDATKKFFKTHKYLELKLPVLSPALVPESYLEVFETHYSFFNDFQKLYLTPSPELFIKRLLAHKIGDSYSLGKSFRNSESPNSLHLSEFEMLEFYKTEVDYEYIKQEIQKLLLSIVTEVYHQTFFIFRNKKIYVDKPWEEITIAKAFGKYAGINEETLFDKKLFLEKAKQKQYNVENTTYVDLFSQIYTQEIEPNLGTNGVPTIITDYPKEMAALAKLKDEKVAERFEFYIEGVELGDCYTELTNAKEQKIRFEKEEEARKTEVLINHPVDWGFIEALEIGLPKCSGIAIGFDRLVMVLLDTSSVLDHQLITIE
jgi:elongation factor P--beta-lysine ligase